MLRVCLSCTSISASPHFQIRVATVQQVRRLRSRQAWPLSSTRICSTAAGSQWRTEIDPATGRTYYWHTETRETRWEDPAETGTNRQAVSGAGGSDGIDDDSSYANMLQTLLAALEQDGSGMLFNEQARSLRSAGVFTEQFSDYVMQLADSAHSEDERLVLQRTVARLFNPLLRQAAPYE